MSGTIRDLSAFPPPALETVKVLVIGSGCGGATAAADLAAKGHEVLVLEEGTDFAGALPSKGEAQRYDQLYMDRAGRTTDDLSISILQGRVLGGGGVINACDVVPPPDPVLRHWQTRYGLAEMGPSHLLPYVRMALDDLSARPIPEEQINRANALLRQGAQALGWKGEVFHDNRKGCLGLGTCFIGCPANAKRNPRFVAIPRALAAGARVYTRARAVRIADPTAELKTVTVRTLDPKGYREPGEFTVRARVVIVAANAINSAQLLLRSGIGNEHVGRHLTLQPQLPVSALFDEEVRGFFGIPQSYALTEFERISEEDGLGGFRVEAVMGTPGIVAATLPYSGMVGKEAMTRYPNLAAALCLVPDRPSGTVTVLESGRPRVRYEPTVDLHQRLREAAKAAARVYLAVGARTVTVPAWPVVHLEREADLAQLDAIRFPPASAPLLSAHQQGTVRFAPSPKDGGADPDGQVYRTKDVYVFDSSGFPTSSSSHTMTPIIAFSHYLTARLLTRLRS